MLNNDYAAQNCSVARTLEIVGERWTLLIIRELLRRPSRFADLERDLEVSKNVLTTRLEKLVSYDVVEKIRYSDTREWSRYSLTAKGRDLFYVIDALMAWGDAHAAPDGPPVIVEHECGHPAGFRTQCECCGEPITPVSVRERPGPGARAFSPASSVLMD